MKRPFVVDTDVMVDFLRGNQAAIGFVRAHISRIMLPAVVVTELYAGVRSGRETEILDEFLLAVHTLPVTPAIAKAGGLYKREFGRSHGVSLGDAIIAATAESEGAELKTFNLKHYPMFQGLKPPYDRTAR